MCVSRADTEAEGNITTLAREGRGGAREGMEHLFEMSLDGLTDCVARCCDMILESSGRSEGTRHDRSKSY